MTTLLIHWVHFNLFENNVWWIDVFGFIHIKCSIQITQRPSINETLSSLQHKSAIYFPNFVHIWPWLSIRPWHCSTGTIPLNGSHTSKLTLRYVQTMAATPLNGHWCMSKQWLLHLSLTRTKDNPILFISQWRLMHVHSMAEGNADAPNPHCIGKWKDQKPDSLQQGMYSLLQRIPYIRAAVLSFQTLQISIGFPAWREIF